MSAFRLPDGGLIDRSQPLDFTFDGQRLRGYQGDSLASALLANGQHTIARSFKYHRPRGVYGTGSEEPNALISVGKGVAFESNLRATMLDLYDGMQAKSQNAWPNAKLDFMAVNQLLSPFLVAGFYYKIFMGSANFWMLPEWFIRRAAGLGKGNTVDETEDYQHHYAFTDVMIVGAGRAGLAAALSASRSGARVTLVDERSQWGGQGLWRYDFDMNWESEVIGELEANPRVTLMSRTTAFGHYDHGLVVCAQIEGNPGEPMAGHMPRGRVHHIRAKKVIYATGAIERPLVFAGNDAPGVMLGHAGLAYANQYGVAVGEKVVIATNNDDSHFVAREMAAKGIQVVLADCRADVGLELTNATEEAGVDLRLGHTIAGARGGNRGASQAEILTLDGKSSDTIECNAVLSSGGWSPAIHLHCHTGGKAEWREDLQAFVAGKRMQDGTPVGTAAGIMDTQGCLNSGWNQGIAAAQNLGFDAPAGQGPVAEPTLYGAPLQALWECPEPQRLKGKAFVDLQNDATAKDIKLANQEGYKSVEHTKRFTTLGMGTDQGKTSNINGHALLAAAQEREIPQVGTTTFRPPYTPVTLGAFAGPHVMKSFAPYRRTPMHEWHVANNASFVEAGLWLRPEWYTRPGEDMWDSIKREARNVRQNVGMCDVSTLGKIDVQGPDALEFIQRLYSNGMKTLPIGKVRYGLMLREDGHVMDDGTVARVGENHYYVTTTTAKAGPVMAHLEYYLDVVWPELKARVASTTDQWAAMSIAGPNARKLLERGFDAELVSNDALPFMGFVDTSLNGCPVRIMRISFSGELAYEIHTPANHGLFVWTKMMELGQALDLQPYGVEALSALRLEKGHVAGGDLHGNATAADMGLGKMVAKKKDFIGRLALQREGIEADDRLVLVGLLPADGKSKIIGGSQISDQHSVGAKGQVSNDFGWVSSAHYSVEMDHPIALAYVKNGAERYGQTLYACSPVDGAVSVPVIVCSPHMIDPSGERHYA